jgi:hypothetical protein
VAIKNLRQFEVGLEKFKKTVETRSVLFVKKVAFLVLGAYIALPNGKIEVVSGLLQLTPVDTGRAVGSWQVTIGGPALGQSPYQPTGSGGGGARSSAERFATREGVAALSSLRFGQNVWITSNLGYIVVLNDGAPNRTAHHMLERAVDNAKRSIRRA